ncbi:MAG TPA: hypothetical protein VG253_19070 [Streptosporangiaceae bacterium]|nr:hypothetical protein [Streptosporangiaceae bacterium]
MKWNIGEKETTFGSFIWRKSPSTLSWDRYSATIVLVGAARGEDGGDLGLHLLPGLAGPAAGEAGADLGELAMGLGEGLVRNGEQPGVIRGGQRADEGKRRAVEQLVVAAGVLPGVVDEGEAVALAIVAVREQRREAGDKLVDHRLELGDIGLVARVGVADQGDAAVGGHHQTEPADAQVVSLLLGVSALRDRGTLVGRVDPGGEVRHIEHEAREVDRERLDHGRDDATLDLLEAILADRVHRLPEPPVVERPGRQAQPPVTGGLVPPV